MEKSQQESEWQDPLTKPTHEGIYKIFTLFGVRYAYYSEGTWYTFSPSINGARAWFQHRTVNHNQCRAWRGLL